MLETLDAAAVRRWCTAGLAGLRACEQEINQLNVYPVPDGDTGTNLVLTLTAAAQAAEQVLGTDPAAAAGTVLRAVARESLLAARGNSGVIMAQMLRGLADTLAGHPAVGGRHLAEALTAAAKASYAAVAEPVEGTILSVAVAAARAATGADSDHLATVTRAAADAAAAALARTPRQLPVLAAAGVVDAGGRGLVVLLDALTEVVCGEPAARRPEPPPEPPQGPPPEPPQGPPPEPPQGPPPGPAATGDAGLVPAGGDAAACVPAGSGGYAYEVQYLLEAAEPAVARLRERLARLGDSLVVVGTGDGLWNVHVHVDDVGAAIEAGVVAGRPYQISVTRFELGLAPELPPAPAEAPPPAGEPAPVPLAGRGAVVVASGDGLVELFTAEGAVVVTGTPSTGEVLAAIRRTEAGQVVLLPNDPNARAAADAAAAEAAADQVRVAVVPTRSPVQALAALAVRDPGRRFDDDVIAMAEAAGSCRYAVVTRAGREALTVAGRCRAGDLLALVDGEVHLIGTELPAVCQQLLDQLLGGGGELVTLLVGADAPDGLAAALSAHLAATWPFVEVQAYRGGQPRYPLIVGVE